MPEIGSLMEQIEKVYTMNKLKANEEVIYRQSWGIKKACGFVKRKGRRGEYTKDSWINLFGFFLDQKCHSIVDRKPLSQCNPVGKTKH